MYSKDCKNVLKNIAWAETHAHPQVQVKKMVNCKNEFNVWQ